MFWCCAQIEPFRERLAMHCLGLKGFEVYCPRLREQVRNRGRKIERTPPLFPGYAFVLIVSAWWTARWSPGVRRLVMDGEQPARVPDAVIAEIRSRERNGLIELPKPRGLAPGMRVKVVSGPLSEQIGMLAVLRPHERVLQQHEGSDRSSSHVARLRRSSSGVGSAGGSKPSLPAFVSPRQT